MVLSKDELEAQLHAEKRQISDGQLKDENPLDLSLGFATLCEACRRGDLQTCQEMISEGVNINARDAYDYSPLILASLCGQYEVVQILLEAGALCERDTFQGERCLYNALTDRIRNLLLQYDYSKSTDPLQPLASHLTSLLSTKRPMTSDITLVTATQTFALHKFVLSARSPFFHKKLTAAPDTTSWKLSASIAPRAFEIAIRYLYLGDFPSDVGVGYETSEEEQAVLTGLEKLSRQLEIRNLWIGLLEGEDRRIARQRRTDEVVKGRDQLEQWYRENVLKHKVVIETSKASEVRWSQHNAIFADVLLRADADSDEDGAELATVTEKSRSTPARPDGIPVGPLAEQVPSVPAEPSPRQSTLFPAHRAMLIRSEFFLTMFSSSFREAKQGDYLQVVSVDCTPEVLEVVLTFLYTEKADMSLDLAIDVLFASDLLLIEKLKAKAAVTISTLGSGNLPAQEASSGPVEPINVYDVLRAGWLTRVHRLEEFAARYVANRLEEYIDQEEFAELIKESATRIAHRQETDSIELLDDIRYYLSERFRLRFEDSGIDEIMEGGELAENAPGLSAVSHKTPEDEGIDVAPDAALTAMQDTSTSTPLAPLAQGAIRTPDGEIAGDEFASDAVNYQLLLGKIDSLLERLKLDA